MRRAVPIMQLSPLFALLAGSLPVVAQPAPVLTWITNSSVKLEQIIGDVDWEAKAQGSNLPTASQTITTNGAFSFADDGTNSGGFGGAKFYRLRAPP